MSKLHDVVEETLISYSDKSTINVMMFGIDKETKQIIDDYPSTHVVTIDNMSHYPVDIIICAHNVTQEEMDDISDLVKTQFSETVIIEESEGGALSTIHQNKYEHFTYLDDNTPNIIVYSKTADITSFVGSSLSVFRSYTGDYVSGVSIQSAPLSNVPFTIIGGTAPLIEPDDLDEDLFDFDNRGGDN
jgi:hypothetical protein